ncbi:MAG: helix-turn-helix domain-containing protein [Alphaproteobacteria bacterium]|nr:helix-turn-helix domain-containing protein [Alphaproteobacteria bacterium]
MYRQLTGVPQLLHGGPSIPEIARSGQLDALIALEAIGTRLRFSRNQEIYAQGEGGGSWYKVISGTVRLSKLRSDGRRNIAEFCFSGDGFGLDKADERSFSAEAVEDVTVMRYPSAATERLIEENLAVARLLRDMALKCLAAAQRRLMILGRMTATERVVSFLLELSARNDDAKHAELPMCRCDIGDYLGITIETVCRVLSDLRRRGVIEVSPHSITLLDRFALEAIGED